MSWSYVGHVVATVPDKSLIAYRVRGYCLLVGCCICLDTPPIASCQGLGGTVRRSAVTSALTRRLSPIVGGQGHWLRAGLARRLCCATRYQGGQLVSRKTAKGYPEVGSDAQRMLDVVES
ncbi:hypothetical protein GW17_00046697 [Ensete ventricosum]|nr:hypothetical protein GW17_00046697 [Ensete ventricosum]